MTLLKALLSLAALLLLSECDEFFLNNNPPNITGIVKGGKIQDKNRYKPICQTLNDEETFVTLYDTKNKIPVFSAAKYRGHEGSRPKPSPWMIEPQLENPDDRNNNMTSENRKITYKNQAALTDYKNKLGFNKGHLFPSSYGSDQNEINSTFTLTNIVPQNIYFNNGRWNNMEQCIKYVMDKFCINNKQKEGFVVIGAQPSTNNILNNKVNIPSILWSAFCCYNSKEKKWLASAHWGENKEENLQTKTLDELHRELGGKSEVFPRSRCPHDKTIKQVDPKLVNVCKCPK